MDKQFSTKLLPIQHPKSVLVTMKYISAYPETEMLKKISQIQASVTSVLELKGAELI